MINENKTEELNRREQEKLETESEKLDTDFEEQKKYRELEE